MSDPRRASLSRRRLISAIGMSFLLFSLSGKLFNRFTNNQFPTYFNKDYVVFRLFGADVKVLHQDRLMSIGFEGKDAVVITVFRRQGGNVVNVSRDLRARGLPANIELIEFYFRPGAMLDVPAAQQRYISSNYTHVARERMKLLHAKHHPRG